MALRTPARATVPSEDSNIIKFDEAPEFMDRSIDDAPVEDMDQQVKEAQQRLAALRAQQEEVERQKHILETLRQKQERFVAGKKELTDKLDRSLRAINEELEDARRRVDDMAITQRDFHDHLEELKGYLPERWHRNQLDHELDRALTALDEAEVAFEKGVRRLSSHRAQSTALQQVNGDEEEAASGGGLMSMSFGGDDDLATWLRRGFAFTLPLIVTVILSIILAKLMF